MIPIYSAVISAAIAFLVSWFSSRWTIRLEIDKLRLSTQQLAFSKLLEARIREYPKLYAILSDLPKALEAGISVDLQEVLGSINEWDSQYAIFMGPETSNICAAFRAILRATAKGESNPSKTAELLNVAARLELALRSEIGIHGIAVSGMDLSPRQRETY